MSVLAVGFGESAGYQTQRSLRFRASASARAYRTVTNTPADTDNKRKTYSMWCKRSALGSAQMLVSSYISDVNFWGFYFSSDDRLCFYAIEGGTAQASKFSAAVFRDVTAHMHVMLVTDTANATAEDRVRLYVNGTRVTSWNTNTTPALNAITSAAFIAPGAGTWSLNIGRLANGSNYFDGYFSEVIGVDGQSLTPSSFGEFDFSGNWRPKAYTGTYGTNGFCLKFDDPTSLTTLMADSSGNGNNWTASNISLTAGATYDSMIDVPLGAGGQERGNYCTLSPVDGLFTVLSNANLRWSSANGNWVPAVGTQAITEDSYWEVTLTQVVGTQGGIIGISKADLEPRVLGNYPGVSANSYGYYTTSGVKFNSGSSSAYGSAAIQGAVIGIRYAPVAGTLTLYVNGVSQGVAFTGLSGDFFPYSAGRGDGTAGFIFDINFGQRPFAYAIPAGAKPLHTGNINSTTLVASGSFLGNVSTNGRCGWCNGTPETLTINGNAVTWGTHADKLATGFKIRTASSSYNSSGTNTWTATYLSPSSNSAFKYQNAKGN